MGRLVGKVTIYLIKNNYIDEDKREECVYGLEIILGKMLNYLTLLLFSVINKNLPETLIFMIVFFSLRKGTGGFHAKRMKNCYMATIGIYFAVVGVIVPVLENILFLKSTVTLCAIITIFLLAPVNHPNLKLDLKEIKMCRNYSRILAVGIGVVIFTFLILKIIPVYISYAIAGVGMDAGLLIIAKIVRQEVNGK